MVLVLDANLLLDFNVLPWNPVRVSNRKFTAHVSDTGRF
uniref:Uncharacterized protein n=1 Tax=Rhizophora mucronata TaxID=61149 RepID=A0A2P2QSA4_RHIMU